MEAKKVAYAKWVECMDEEEKWMLKEVYRAAKTKDKLAVTMAKTTISERLYIELKKKGEDKKIYRLSKARERKDLDLDQLNYVKDKEGKVLVKETFIKQR